MLKPIFEFDYWGLPVYNIMGAVGVFFSLLVLLKKEKELHISTKQEERINSSFIIAGLLSLAFANVANWFLFPEVLNYPLSRRMTLGGLSFYYGMFGFFASVALLLRFQKIDFRFWINEAVPPVLILHAFGRIGCSLIGCCYGIHIKPISVFGLLVEYFPAREAEALCLFAMFFVFRYIIKENRFLLYLFSYSVIRFILEFGRGDNRGQLLFSGLSPAQETSILVWIILSLWGTYQWKR